MNFLPPEKLDRLYKALDPLHHQYDPVARMLKAPFRSFGFLKILQGFPVHPTRESLSYAAALLDTSDHNLHQRAIRILQQVLSLQDQKPSSKTYGVWPKYLEEKPFKIVQPDQNWCNFLGTQMLQIALNHRHSLPPKLMAEIDKAILHAARSIQQRKVPIEYTNIAIMGIYVKLITAQIYELTDLHDYAITRLRNFHAHTLEQGGFNEYNSPTYTIITLKVLGRLRLHVENIEAKQLIEDLYRLAWEEIAHHFHPSTLQWAGPHSRSYNTLLEADVIALIERSTSECINFGIAETHPAIDEHWLLLPCPQDLEPFFLPLNEPRTVSQALFKKSPKQVLTTYLTPTFCLGTVNYSDLWHQRRPLLAYWGTVKEPSYLWLRCLHNGVDFAAAQFFSVQSEGNVLAGVSFSKDINPVNPYIQSNPHDSRILTKDLRLRFEFGGSLNTAKFKTQIPSLIDSKSLVHLSFGNLHFQILIPYAQFGQTTAKWEIHQGASYLYLDLVFWSGKQQVFHLVELEQAAIGIALQIMTEVVSVPEVLTNAHDNCLDMHWQHLNLKLLTRPDDQLALNTSVFS
jgi:hypothetical protein